MRTYRVELASTPAHAGSLLSWLTRQGQAARITASVGTMGGAETISMSVVGLAVLRSALLIVREWISAHRVTITVTVDGTGSFKVEGTEDIDRLLHLLGTQADSSEHHA